MKKFVYLGLVLIALSASFFFYTSNDKEELVYDYKQSWLEGFEIKGNKVVFDTMVYIENNSDKSIEFHMFADVEKEGELVKNKVAVAINSESEEKQLFSLDAGEGKLFSAQFTVEKGEKSTKSDRNPPVKVTFEIVK